MNNASAPLEALRELACRAALAGGRVASRWQGAEGLEIREKVAPDDLVSQADEEAESAIRETLRAERPGDRVVGEELAASAGDSGVWWLIDPIDGTTSFLYGRADWAVSVAAVRAEDDAVLAGAVAEPALGRLTSACLGGGTTCDGDRAAVREAGDVGRALIEVNFGSRSQRAMAGATVDALLPHVRDLRRTGSAAAALAHVASGRADAYWGPGLRDWDVAAGLLLVTEAGGEVGDLEATRAPAARGGWDVLATAPGLRAELRELIAATWAPDGADAKIP